MGRTISSNLLSILNVAHDIDITCDIFFPDGTHLHYATSTISVNGFDYTNYLEKSSLIKHTKESPTDRVSVTMTNLNRVLSLHLAAYWRKWQAATAVVGRLYKDKAGVLTDEWKEMFTGVVEQPVAGDLNVTFTVISDVTSPGAIIANRSLADYCSFVFKMLKTCGYTGPETLCNHKRKGDCKKYNWEDRFGGWENPEASVPQPPSGGDIDPPIDIEPPPQDPWGH